MEKLKGDVKEIVENVPSHHGWQHILEVRRFAKALSGHDFYASKVLEAASYLHDLRKWDDQELRARKIKVPWREKGADTDAKSVLREYKTEVRRDIFPFLEIRKEKRFWQNFVAYRNILEAVRDSGKLPSETKEARETTKTLRDADRLARAGIEGLRSILEANKDYGTPFHNPGGEIVRAKDAPMIPEDGIKSCVDDINFCAGDWERIMETDGGKVLMPILDQVNHKFLEIFNQNSEITDYDVWIGWLESILSRQKPERDEINAGLESGDFDRFIAGRTFIENPDLLAQESFDSYRHSSGNL
jgi:hypothetical protein